MREKVFEVSLVVFLGFLVALVFLPMGTQHAGTARVLKSQVQARSLIQASIVFATENEDRFPTAEQWPDLLIELGIIEPELLVSEVEDGDGVSYIYLPIPSDYSEGDYESRIVIYEDPKHFNEGVVVGFADARTEIVPHEEFERMLAAQLKGTSETP